MFLSKKNAAYLTRPNKNTQIKTRVLPGWGDDDNDTLQQYEKDYTRQMQAQNKTKDPFDLGLLDQNQIQSKKSEHEPVRKVYYDWDELNDMENIQCEKKLVQGIVEVGGVRIKPNDNMLSEFLKQCKGMQPKYIGSLLMSKLEANYPFQVKAKALYTIQYLVKKNQLYTNYFKVQSERIKDFPEPEQNVENYKKIRKTVLNTIGISLKNQTDKQQAKITFQDPGYNNQPEKQVNDFIRNNPRTKKTQGGSKKFISPAQMKKQGKNITNNQVIGSNSTNNNNFGLDDLILVDTTPSTAQNATNNNDNDIRFDDLLSGNSINKQQQVKFDFM